MSSLRSLRVFNHNYAYLDSGAPHTSTNYTTWVICHGLAFHGAVFEKLLPLAHTHNLRIVSLIRRGYPPSSGFQEDELECIGRGKKLEDAEPFFRAQGTEIATFLVNFATEQNIPPTDENSSTGGIVLIGWSLASAHMLMVLAYAPELPQDTRSMLEKYLHTVLFHDAILSPLGIPIPQNLNLDLFLETDDRRRLDAFWDWVTAHYIHKSITSENPDDLEFNNPSDIPHSLHELSYAQRSKYTHMEAFLNTGCDAKLTACNATAFVALTKRALFDKAHAKTLPNVRVRYMAGRTSSGLFIWLLWMLQKFVENPCLLYGSDAEKAKDIKCVVGEGNHFIFWEDPENAVQNYSAAINM